ncbi:MAG: D-aminoacylase [Alphaproteobacteria bacterium]|nr:D-aminoacylase [Alphaproteobacteria bacterium]MDP6831247.1 D-aminoacylase [Alphaproteobacteria bacterium]
MASPDIIIRNGTVIDGTGAAGVRADVAVTGDRISAVGDLGAMGGAEEIDAQGQVVAPGFIDVHTHDDRYLFTHPEMAPKASQGVTTVVVGNCGFSLAPWRNAGETQFPMSLWRDREDLMFETAGAYLEGLERTPAALNAAMLVGHSSLRYGAMDDVHRPATDSEIGAMQDSLRGCIDEGAIGMSSGLFYPPAQAAKTEEVAAVAEVMAAKDGIYTAHIRDEAEHVMDALEEVAQIGRDAGVQVVISHHKASGLSNFGKTKQTLPLIEKFQEQQRLTLDMYPYHASSTMILPHLVHRSRKIIITWSQPRPDVRGRDLAELAAEMELDLEAAAKALAPGGAIYFQMDEEDVQRVLSYPGAMIGSDGIPDDQHPHPRLWGTFPRVLGHYARDLGLMPLEAAVHRMSGLPAAQFGFKDRGELRDGAFADLVIFNPKTISDSATFDAPTEPAIGIDRVFVNGQTVWNQGRASGERPGRPIRLGDTSRGGYM